jgi:hypothetical protein
MAKISKPKLPPPPKGLHGALCSLEEVLYFVLGDESFSRRTRKLARDVMKKLKEQRAKELSVTPKEVL